MSLRKKLHNQLVELRGNIRVFCRVRPPISEDGNGSNTTIVVHPDRDDDGLLYVHRGNRKVFEMDKVFGPDSKQEEVFTPEYTIVLIIICIPVIHYHSLPYVLGFSKLLHGHCIVTNPLSTCTSVIINKSKIVYTTLNTKFCNITMLNKHTNVISTNQT